MYAIVSIKGKQYKVGKGDLLQVDRFDEKIGSALHFDSVLLVAEDGKEPKIGTPFVNGAKVSAKLIENFKDKKVIVFKYRRRKDSMSKRGHRQQYSTLEVTSIKSTPARSKVSDKDEK